MRKTLWLPALSALALIGTACKDEAPKLNSSDTTANNLRPDSDKTASRMPQTPVDGQRDAVLGADSRATVKTEPADKQALRVQRDDKLGNPVQAQQDEKAQYGQAKNDSLAVPKSAAGETSATQTQTIVGQVASASDSQVDLKSSDDRDLKLAIDAQTSVRIDGQTGRAAQISQGSEVRASYKNVDGKMTALRLDVTSKAGQAK